MPSKYQQFEFVDFKEYALKKSKKNHSKTIWSKNLIKNDPQSQIALKIENLYAKEQFLKSL